MTLEPEMQRHTELKPVLAGFRLLTSDQIVQRGDFWLRPTDRVWIETGVSHWGTQPDMFNRFARPIERRTYQPYGTGQVPASVPSLPSGVQTP